MPVLYSRKRYARKSICSLSPLSRNRKYGIEYATCILAAREHRPYKL